MFQQLLWLQLDCNLHYRRNSHWSSTDFLQLMFVLALSITETMSIATVMSVVWAVIQYCDPTLWDRPHVTTNTSPPLNVQDTHQPVQYINQSVNTFKDVYEIFLPLTQLKLAWDFLTVIPTEACMRLSCPYPNWSLHETLYPFPNWSFYNLYKLLKLLQNEDDNNDVAVTFCQDFYCLYQPICDKSEKCC